MNLIRKKFYGQKYNKLILITAPSGAGKTSIVKYLMTKFPQLAFSVSATTRKARDNEKDGEDYYFISEKNSEKKFIIRNFLNGKWFMKENIMAL